MRLILIVTNMKKILIVTSFLLMLFASACQMTYECGPAADWSFDEDKHWHACVIPTCTDYFDEEDHVYGSWTTNDEGVEVRECSVCGYKQDRNGATDGHEHNYASKWSTNKNEHWHACNGCSVPGDKAEHSWTEISKVEATYSNPGEIVKECSVCKYQTTETIPAIEHTCNYGDSWKTDADSHWYECSLCHEKKDLDIHNITVNADNGQTQNISCSVCGYNGTRPSTDTWDKVTVSKKLSGSGTESDPYQIHSGADLAYFKANASSMSGKYVKLFRDIDVNGSSVLIELFDGVLDGNNKTIKGLNILDYSDKGVAFIRTLNTNGVIKDLTLQGSVVGFTFAGSFASLSKGTITGCTSRVNITAEWTVGGIVAKNEGTITSCANFGNITNGKAECGGIAGYHVSGKINSCTNHGTISSTNWAVGGIAGKATAEIESCTNNGSVSALGHLGGIVGNNSAKVKDCTNNGLICYADLADDKGCMGGIVGEANGVIENCENNSTVSGNWGEVGGIVGRANAEIKSCKNNANASVVGGAWSVGGIAGISTANITSCTNYASVSGVEGGVGGIVGEMDWNKNAVVSASENHGSVSAKYNMGGIVGFLRNNTVENCKNHGNVYGTGVIGGIVGLVETGTVKNCENTSSATVNGSDTTGGIIGKVDNNASLKATISGCTNNGTVKGNWYLIGGIFGAADSANISDCTNNGNVSSDNDCVGGIAGAFYALAVVENCTNNGAVSGTKNVAGVVFDNQGTLTNCDNTGSVTATNADGSAQGIYVNNSGTIDATCEDLR